jgi:hypothetical protein
MADQLHRVAGITMMIKDRYRGIPVHTVLCQLHYIAHYGTLTCGVGVWAGLA